ncbi:probable glucose transporter Hxt5p [Trichomonascus vanleenenianus]|uniref:putative glucose transporter Hxt5p n=1 Tax=Trichomonascus vanleenenianus TaxID=2268995 RepID=UPI003ECB92C3
MQRTRATPHYLTRRRDKIFFSVIPCAPQIMLCCAMGFTLFGYDTALLNGIIINKYFRDAFNEPSAASLSQITSTFDLGCFLGCIAICFVGDYLGRRRAIFLGCMITIVGAILQTSTFTVAQFIVGRVIAGIGNGMLTSTVPVWLAETCGPLYRGKFIACQLAIADFGCVIVGWINYGMRSVDSSFAWRFPIGLQCFFAVTCSLMCLYLPESPRWLVSRNAIEESGRVLSLLLKKPVDDVEIQTLRDAIEIYYLHEKAIAATTSWKDLLRNDETQNLRRIILGASAQMFQQLGGINVINYYMTYIVQNYAGFDQSDSLILSVGNSMNLVFFTFVGVFLIDRMGRKKSSVYGWIGGGLCYLAVTVCLALATRTSRLVAVAFMFLYITIFACTTNVVPWLYPAEVNSQRWRFLGGGVSTATNWIFNYIIVLITPIATSNIGWRYYIIFVVFNFTAAAMAQLFYVETMNLSLEQVDDLFAQDFHKRRGEEYEPPIGSVFDQNDIPVINSTAEHIPFPASIFRKSVDIIQHE